MDPEEDSVHLGPSLARQRRDLTHERAQSQEGSFIRGLNHTAQKDTEGYGVLFT